MDAASISKGILQQLDSKTTRLCADYVVSLNAAVVSSSSFPTKASNGGYKISTDPNPANPARD
jgi:hypothetical protein